LLLRIGFAALKLTPAEDQHLDLSVLILSRGEIVIELGSESLLLLRLEVQLRLLERVVCCGQKDHAEVGAPHSFCSLQFLWAHRILGLA